MLLALLLIAGACAQQQTLAKSENAGAIYTISNAATMNQVLVYRLDTNGQLEWVRSYDTQGTGVTTTAGDPLSSQGSVIVHANYLFVVNPGSNSMSMFLINRSDPTELKFIAVESTLGLFPVSITVNSMYACVLTGGSSAGIRCFTYSQSGLSLKASFDRDLTTIISQSHPPSVRAHSLSQIQFSADDRTLIVSVKAFNATSQGYLLFYPLNSNNNQLTLEPIRQTLPKAVSPFSMTLVGRDGLLITDPGARGALTLTYSSVNGAVTGNAFTPVDSSLAAALCWSTFSSVTGNYYIIGSEPAAIVELHIDLSSKWDPTKIIRYYSLPKNTGALEATIVTLNGVDHLFVLGVKSQVISAYRLNGPGNAVANGIFPRPEGSSANIPKLAGIAAFLKTRQS